jgi:hypothetical protein
LLDLASVQQTKCFRLLQESLPGQPFPQEAQMCRPSPLQEPGQSQQERLPSMCLPLAQEAEAALALEKPARLRIAAAPQAVEAVG